MGLLSFLRPKAEQEPARREVRAMVGEYDTFLDLKDPRLREFLQGGHVTASGATVSVEAAMRNTTVLRCVSLIASAIGMLPLHLRRRETKEKAEAHPLFPVLHRKPNAWQTAYEFRSLMQQRVLQHGDAYATIIRSGRRVVGLVPLDPRRVTPKQRADWMVEYEFRRPDGSLSVLSPDDVFHLRGALSEDGIQGLSLVKQAAEAIGLALQTEKAAARLFLHGMLAGGAIQMRESRPLSDAAYDRLRADLEAREGASMAHKWMLLEDGLEAKPFSQTGRDSQHLEMRQLQVEEIARAFGVPRPLLMMDDTSWGSGIDVLGQFFVRYALNPWFEAWQQGVQRSLLGEAEQDVYEARFNPGALLRGSMKDQAEFFAKALGSGGHQPWMDAGEVRDLQDMPRNDNLPPPPGQTANGDGNEPPQSA